MSFAVSLRRTMLACAAIVGPASCAHEITSPTPALTAVAPDLVCNGPSVSGPGGAIAVALTGARFTPMPADTLDEPRRLILPEIALEPAGALPGGEAPARFVVPDAPPPGVSRVHWSSEAAMAFDVVPDDEVPAGVFDVTVTNPDGTRASRKARTLAVIPPPLVTTVAPPAICDDQDDQTVVVTGANFLFHDGAAPTVTLGSGADLHTYPAVADPAACAPIAGDFTETGVVLCTALSFTVPEGDLVVTATTTLPLIVTNPAPADCASSSTPVDLTINPPPRVDSVIPGTVCAGGSTITINGANLQDGATVELVCGTTVIAATAVTVTPDGTQASATFAGGAPAGATCEVVVRNPDGCEDRPLPHRTVTVRPGPIVFLVSPEVVYNAINTRVTIYATTITQPLGANAVTITPAGMAAPVTVLAVNAVPGRPNRLQAIVPAGQAPGAYDLHLSDASSCSATLAGAITVTADATVTIASVRPPFGHTAEDTAVQLARDVAAPAPGDHPFVETPSVFLNPTSPAPTDVAVQLASVAFLDGDRVTGVVPAGTPPHVYDVVLVNPDGTVGVLAAGYQVTATPPPTIATATPASIVSATGQVVVLAGDSFAAGNTVTLTCATPTGTTVLPPVVAAAPACTGSACTESITIDGSTAPAGSVCVVRLTNPDGTYGELSAIGVTNASRNLNAPRVGPPLTVGRRALSAAAGNATAANRFVYAIGGDDGTAAGALATVEHAPVDPFGAIGAFAVQRHDLRQPRTLAGAATVGRYIYLVGGNGGSGPVATAERALILSPRETPDLTDVDVALAPVGLEPGRYHYRVSAVWSATDPDNPGGESLASDPLTIRVPAFPDRKVVVTLVIRPPTDALGTPLPNVVGYRVYRTRLPDDAPGTEVLLGADAITTTGTTFADDGTRVPAAATPLPLGSTGRWAALPALATAREGLAVTWARDPVAGTTLYLYALLGRTGPATASATYEYLPITIAANGRQTAAGAWIAGTLTSTAPRWQLGAWTVDATVSPDYVAPATHVFLGGGLTAAGMAATRVESGLVGAGGALVGTGTAWNDTPKDFSAPQAGYGVCAANDQLFAFGGGGAMPRSQAKSALLVSPPPALDNQSWNDEGLAMTHGRYLLGSAVQSSFIFLLGGQTDEPSAASRTTELVIW